MACSGYLNNRYDLFQVFQVAKRAYTAKFSVRSITTIDIHFTDYFIRSLAFTYNVAYILVSQRHC